MADLGDPRKLALTTRLNGEVMQNESVAELCFDVPQLIEYCSIWTQLEPGDALVYNNSAYFLLGLVIERVSGMPYARYVQEQLFDRAGLRDARYCSNTEVVARRARGYEATPQGLRRAEHLDHTWPYAAGSLCASGEDMVAWSQALHGGRVLGAAAYRELVTPGLLNDGTEARGVGRTLATTQPK